MRDVVHGLNVYRRDRKERRAKAVDVVLLYYRHGAALPRAGPGRAAGTLESDSQILRFSHPQILKFLNLNRQAIVTAGLLLFLATPAAAQQPLASPPASPQFLSRYDFHLSAAALANDDQRFSWDAHFGGDIDVLDYVYGRAAAVIDYEAVLGNELRPFDPNQGNYILELSTSYRIKRTEVAAIFHHVSRHLSDRRKVIPIAWNILGVRALREARIGKGTIDVVADFGGTTEKVNVDYRWSSNVDVVVRLTLYP